MRISAFGVARTAMTVVEMFGEKKHETVKDAVAKDKIEKNPVVTREVIITEKGNTLCYDAISGRYFKGDIDKIKKAECELNRQMRDEMYVSLNDFYYEVGLDNIKIGDELGWNIDNGYINLSFSSQLAGDGTPCLVIDYSIAPRYDFLCGCLHNLFVVHDFIGFHVYSPFNF